MLKKVFLIIFICFLSSLVFAYEKPVSDFGVSQITNSQNSTSVCKEFTINLTPEELLEKGEGVLSINANFISLVNDSTYVSVSINNEEIQKFWQEDFVCGQNCWARVFLPQLKKGPVKINLCAVLGGASKGLVINTNSFVGIYDTPQPTIVSLAPQTVYLGDRAEMKIVVSNLGTKSTNVFIQFVHPDTRAKVQITSFDIVEGDSSSTTTIEPKETKEFKFYVKPSQISAYNLPLAALFFTNFFGEAQTIKSNHPYMNVIEKKQINLTIVSITEDGPRIFKALVKNNYSKEFSGVITFTPQTAFDTYSQVINLPPNGSEEMTFVAKTLDQGKYVFQATIRDQNKIYSSNQLHVEVTKQGVSAQVLIAILGIVVGAIIFGWIYFSKEK